MASNTARTMGKLALSAVALGIIAFVTLALVAGIIVNCTGIIFTQDTCGPGDNFLVLLVIVAGISATSFVLWLIWRSPNAPERQRWTQPQAPQQTEDPPLRYPL